MRNHLAIRQLLAFLMSALALFTAVQCAKEDQDPMLAEESQSYNTGVTYSSGKSIESDILDMLKQQSSSRSLVNENSNNSPRSDPSSYFKKPLLSFVDSSNSADDYKKSSSEYWSQQIGDQSDNGDDQAGYDSYQDGHKQSHQQQYQSPNSYYTPHQGYSKGKEISIVPDRKPITLHYRTHAQPIIVRQTRIPGPKPEIKRTTSHEEPHRVVHEVIRPIIQEVHEIIQPYRRVVQQVQPVIEEIRTVIAKDGGKDNGSYRHESKGNLYSSPQNKRPSMKVRPYKAAVFQRDSPHNSYGSEAMASNKVTRSKVFINKKGTPVYQSNYMGPAYMNS